MRIIRCGSGSVVTWRRTQMVLLGPGMDVSAIAKVAFTSESRVWDVIRNFNADGFGSLVICQAGLGEHAAAGRFVLVLVMSGPGR